MSALTVFNFKNNEIRTVAIDGEPWFVAKDVAEILGLDTAAIARSVDDEDKALRIMQTPGGDQEMTVINESGLYSMILKSRKKEAKAFKRWVTSEVLPSIRKTGSYSIQREPLTELDRMAGMMNQFLPALAGSVTEIRAVVAQQTERLEAVEERQKQVDPQEIERRMAYLDKAKDLLVKGTKNKPQPVTFGAYWRTLKGLIGINSFQNRAALTVPMMDTCVEYAQTWCKERGVQPPSLFDQAAVNDRPA